MAMHAIEMVEKACAEAEEAHILAEDSSTEAQLAWNKAVSANKIRAEYEAAAARARADATRTMEEASTKAEEDAALRPSSEANAKAFLAKAAFARVTAAKALSETAAKSRIDATLSMMQAATDAGALAAAQSAARKAVEVVITCWELVAKLNAGKAIARAAAAARDASMLANKVLEEAETDTVKARQAALDAAARVVAAKSKAARMTTGRRTAEDAAEKAAAVRLSRPGVEAVKQEADAAVATLAAEEAAAKEVEAESIMELKAAASSRKVAEQAKSVWEQAARVAQETFDKKLELERDKAARVELMKATEVLAAEKNLVLAELDAKAEVARKAARGGAKSGKAIAERTEYESRKADFTANKAREIATVVNNEVHAHQAAINSFDEKIADVMVEYAALTANTDSLLLEANRLDADACELEAIADKANQAAKRARQKARDAHERKEMLARSVVEEYDAMIQDQKDAVDLAAAIREAQSLEQAALEELHKEEKMAHSLSETYQELEQLRKAADLDARQKAPLALNAAADEKGEGRMKLEAVKGTLGTPTQFTIEAFDETGSQQPDGGDTFLVCIRCTSQGTRIHARITDNGDGTYTVRFKPITWGACTVSVSLLKSHGIFGEPLPGSPFQCYISGVTPSASQCSVKPPMAPAIACVPTHFYVSFRDERAPGISNKSRTGSTKGSFKRNGEVLGYAHFTPPARPAASREVMTSTAKASYKDPNEKQPIVKYDPNALRNRLPVVFEGAAKPFARFCQVRNNHTYDFMNPGNGAKPPGFNPYRTTSQNFFAYDTQMLAVGESNQGIVSEKARNLHRQILQ
ncbi:putative gelation factor [Chrysochromulina tobinii]|uniref:Putative gelation factor n=1 Tax=Chrysochromulina tobinii TaxID=1460289 RepID=A0A0M0JIB2_9EUKA|nr:putative gelation factor [Chrysochromulina tobinii]|eukprot:KOO25948.1 putative gelation factor [Chrysochromulina sp. CCMP291]